MIKFIIGLLAGGVITFIIFMFIAMWDRTQ
jgi:hypothetical protein